MTRAEHIEWAKQRALAHVERNELGAAYASMVSDLGKHAETRDHHGLQLGLRSMSKGHFLSAVELRRWIEGFN